MPPLTTRASSAPPAHADAPSTPGDAVENRAATRVLRALHAADDPLTAAQIADALSRHHTGVRPHLALLVRLGVLVERRDAPSGRGRPATRYAIAPARDVDADHRHAGLVRVVLRLAGDHGFTAADAERIGESHGHAIAEADGGAEEVRRQFSRLGFAPTDTPGRPRGLELQRCPFSEQVAGPGGMLVCAMHRGFAHGVACHSGWGGALIETDPLLMGGCRVILRPASPAPDEAADAAGADGR